MKLTPGAIILGLVVGFIAAPMVGLTTDVAESMYDRAYPVIEARADVVHKSPSEWRLIMYSRKHRDCRLLEVQAYDISSSRDILRLSFAREDGAAPSAMPPGNFRSATYLLTPAPKHSLMLAFLHECNGRTVRTPVPVMGG